MSVQDFSERDRQLAPIIAPQIEAELKRIGIPYPVEIHHHHRFSVIQCSYDKGSGGKNHPSFVVAYAQQVLEKLKSVHAGDIVYAEGILHRLGEPCCTCDRKDGVHSSKCPYWGEPIWSELQRHCPCVPCQKTWGAFWHREDLERAERGCLR